MIIFAAIVSVIRNFNMDLYLKLSTKFKGKCIALLILTLSSCLTVGSQTYCHIWNWKNEKKCFQFLFLRTCQALMVPTLTCCLLVFSDLFTTKYRKKITELRRIGYRCCHENTNTGQENNSVSVAVIELQHNNFFPNPCCSVKEHVRLQLSFKYYIMSLSLSLSLSTGFITLLMKITAAWIASLVVEEPVWSWELSGIFILTSFITASIWVLRERDLRNFTLQAIKKMLTLNAPRKVFFIIYIYVSEAF